MRLGSGWPGGDARRSVSSRGLLGFRDRPKKMKEVLHVRNFQRVMNSLIHADQSQAASVFLAANVSPDQRSNRGRIRQRDVREIENEGARLVGA